MTPEPSFESLSYKPFSVDGNLTVNAELDPDVNFFQNISSLDTQYFNIDDAKTFVNNNISSDSFSVLHINIRSMQKNFEKFQEFFKTLTFKLNSTSAVCLSESRCDSIESTKNRTIGFVDINPFIKLEMVAKEEGPVFFYVIRYLIK